MIYLFDFEDSFTYNIANEIWNFFKKEVKVESYKSLLNFEFKAKDKVLLGPGPGHPLEYKEIFPVVEKLLTLKEIKLSGICLGHQLIWSSLGASVVHSKIPTHGQAVSLNLDEYWKTQFHTQKNSLSVQRYNSLVVERNAIKKSFISEYNCLFLENELMASRGKNFSTVQFHPESIGTEDSQNILRCLLS